MTEMTIGWNYGTVALSVITAIIGSYVALYFAGRLRQVKSRERMLWTILGAASMGLAIWTMHFVGMLAVLMPMPMTYDPLLSFLSMLAAAVGAGLAFLILQRSVIGRVQYIFGSIAMGMAISTMHYTGMASMKMPMQIIYDPVLFILSIAVAMFASAGALWLAFRPSPKSTAAVLLQKIGSAIVMGLAISGMHYTGMLAAHYYHTGPLMENILIPSMVGTLELSQLLIVAAVVFGLALIVLSAQAFAERQKIIEALRVSERRFQATFEQAAVGIGMVGSTGKFIQLNQKYCDILGYSQEELAGKTFQELTYSDDLSTDLELYERLKARTIPNYTIEKRYIRKDGSLVWVNLTVSIAWDEQDRFDYAIAVVEDITQKKKAEEALSVYATKLEQSNKDLEQFATVASHDLQAPLRKVIMFSEGLKAKEGSGLSEEGKDYIERMQRATKRMQYLITDLLVLSRINRKGNPFKPTRLAAIIDEALEDLESVIREADARIELSGEFPRLEADERQLQQAFLNLVGNSLKFHKEDHAPKIVISSETTGKHCRITVQDDGIGFQPEYAERIFGVFERLHGQDKYPGTGVGLAIVQKIIERHHGTITASSQPGQGATFTITMPLSQPDSQSESFPVPLRAAHQ